MNLGLTSTVKSVQQWDNVCADDSKIGALSHSHTGTTQRLKHYISVNCQRLFGGLGGFLVDAGEDRARVDDRWQTDPAATI